MTKFLRRTWAEIDEDALAHNFKIIKESAQTKVCAVVKANAYGHGADIAAPILQKAGADFFAVSNVEEALELSNRAVVEALDGLPTHKIHCSVLAEEAVKAAVKDYYDKNNIAYDPEKFKNCGDCEHCQKG